MTKRVSSKTSFESFFSVNATFRLGRFSEQIQKFNRVETFKKQSQIVQSERCILSNKVSIWIEEIQNTNPLIKLRAVISRKSWFSSVWLTVWDSSKKAKKNLTIESWFRTLWLFNCFIKEARRKISSIQFIIWIKIWLIIYMYFSLKSFHLILKRTQPCEFW